MRWLTRLFTRRPRSESPSALWIYVACSRCGEAIRVRADRRYDLVSEMRDPGRLARPIRCIRTSWGHGASNVLP